jgi:Tol biopolymer transport system component
MAKNMNWFIPVLVIISLILSVALNYSQNVQVEARAIGTIQTINDYAISSNTTSRIAFISNRDGIDEIYSMNTDGSNQVRLTGTEAANCGPVISPDGSKIVFYSFRDGPIPEIYIMNADGTNPVRITNNAAYDVYPTWTPDGNKIVFVSNRDGSNNIYLMNDDGTNPVRLTNNPLPDEQPSCWSPDGTRIAFASAAFGSAFGIDGYEIYTMNLDGSNQTRLTNNTKRDFEPAWSPDGTKIAFTSWRNLETEIFVMDSDGNNQTKLASGAYPTWSPDGTKIAFTSWYNGNSKIFVMNADGSNQTQLTNSTGLDSNPCWGVVNGIAPSLGGGSVNNISTNSTELEGNLTSFGSAPDAYVTFEWGAANNVATKAAMPITQNSRGNFSFISLSNNNLTAQSVGDSITYTHETPPIKMSSTGSFSFSLTDLDPGTTYYFHSKAFRQGTSYSQETSFTTNYLASIPGDANGNGVVDMADVIYVEKAILGSVPATPGCDANLDGTIDIADVLQVERIILGVIVATP